MDAQLTSRGGRLCVPWANLRFGCDFPGNGFPGLICAVAAISQASQPWREPVDWVGLHPAVAVAAGEAAGIPKVAPTFVFCVICVEDLLQSPVKNHRQGQEGWSGGHLAIPFRSGISLLAVKRPGCFLLANSAR